MSDLKHRKVPRDESINKINKSKSSNKGLLQKTNRIQFYILTILIFTTCLFGVYLHLFQSSSSYSHKASLLEGLSLSLGLKNYIYAVVIDAGSTGTRVLCYGFLGSLKDERSLKLHKEYFKEVQPGISEFANNPPESVKNLKFLLNEAKTIIPKKEWSQTSLMMRATAGLRLLPGQKADALLDEARKYFQQSGFRVAKDAVSLLNEADEGLFSWFSVNYLLDRFGEDASNTVAALDLGGGSIQVSFVPLKNDTLSPSNSEYITKVVAFHKNLDVYSRSYLGLGRNEARNRILTHNSNHSLELKSVCINPLVKKKWSYRGVSYTVKGSDKPHYHQSKLNGEVFTTPIVSFKECEEVAKSVVLSFEKPPSLLGKEIYAFSYFSEIVADSGLIDIKTGGAITLKELISTAQAKCREANVDQPFLCLDLVYISVLLRDAYGILETTKINLKNLIDGHNVNWALGAAFFTLQNQMQQ